MIKEIDIKVPMHLSGITLREYMSWMKILDKYKSDKRDDEEFLRIKMLQTFCNLKIEDTYNLPLNNFNDIVGHIANLFSEDNRPFLDTFNFKDASGNEVEFGFIPNLDEMTFGEYVDLDKYINDNQNFHKAMAVLFRPKTNILNSKYRIESYEGSAKWSEHMLDMPVDVMLGAMSFILRLQTQLSKHTLLSSQQKVVEGLEVAIKKTSEENLDGFNPFTLWLKKMRIESMMQ